MTEIWASAKSFTDVFCIGAKAVGSNAIQSAMENSLATLRVCMITGEDIRTCLSRHWKDFEDCFVARAAERVKADFIVTRDARGSSSRPSRSPTPSKPLAASNRRGSICARYSSEHTNCPRIKHPLVFSHSTQPHNTHPNNYLD